ncbi:MAG TPA: hypothetical protein VKY54_11065 [Kiloniellales bacterium]|nr:hypothetical protein [Kiloniellales bacterium]
MRRLRPVLIVLLILLLGAGPSFAQDEAATQESQDSTQDSTTVGASEGQLPDARTTSQAIQLKGEEIRFTATAGSLVLRDEEQTPEAELAYIAYTSDSHEAAERPITFAVNGGPGAASAYLHLGVLGPWLLPMDEERIVPSQPIALVENSESWLTFTDLVFVDPVETGFSRLLDSAQSLRQRYLSVEGDIDALARFVTDWLVKEGRLASPVYFVGESYGGFRGPLLAEALQTDYGIGLRGLVLLSPVLDFGWWTQPDHSPMPLLSSLPSVAAAGMERAGSFSEEKLVAVEDYAAGDFVVDLLRGVQEEEVLDRLADRLAQITHLPRELVRDHEGRLDMETLVQALGQEEDRIASPYDTTILGDAPLRGKRAGRAADPVLDAMTAPLTSAMLALYRDRLEWLPERRYHLLNRKVNGNWSWGSGRRQPEAVGALQRVLALDPAFQVLVVHGYTDLVTPYFASELILRQLRDFPDPERVRQENYRGGHMFYSRAASRRAFRDDAAALYEKPSSER